MTQDLVIEAFTELAPSYEETVDRELRSFWGLGYRDFVDRFVAKAPLRGGESVLDVATGTAFIPMKIAGRVGATGKITGLDITPAMLALAKENIERPGLEAPVRLACGSALDMPFAAAMFDVVLCGLGMHHMATEQMLAEMRRVLRPGGKLVMADIGASAFWRSTLGIVFLKLLLLRYGLSHKGARAKAEREAYPNIHTAGEWRSLLSRYGFDGIEITEFPAIHRWYPSALILNASAE